MLNFVPTELTIDDLAILRNVLKEAASRWHYIGLNLNLSQDELNNIQLNPLFVVRGVEEYFLRMLEKWLQSAQEKRVRTLQSVLEKEEFGHLASQLIQKLNSGKFCSLCIHSV